MSSVTVVAMALPMILLTVSPMPMGRTPGHLSKAMSRHATKADRPLGSTRFVLSHLATAARLSHSPVEADLKEVQRRFHDAASKPDGPAVPSILKAVLRMSWPSILSKMMGWGSVAGMFGFTSASSLRGCFGGCCFSRMSRTLSE